MTTKLAPRPTAYKGVQMRSRLEAGFAAWLDRWHFDWTYEPRAYASELGQYLPDFELSAVSTLGAQYTVFIEVKPKSPDYGLLYRQCRIIRATEPRALLLAMWPDGGGFEALWADGPVAGSRAVWVFAGPDVKTPRLEFPLAGSFGPWHGEYWKPTP